MFDPTGERWKSWPPEDVDLAKRLLMEHGLDPALVYTMGVEEVMLYASRGELVEQADKPHKLTPASEADLFETVAGIMSAIFHE